MVLLADEYGNLHDVEAKGLSGSMRESKEQIEQKTGWGGLFKFCTVLTDMRTQDELFKKFQKTCKNHLNMLWMEEDSFSNDGLVYEFKDPELKYGIYCHAFPVESLIRKHTYIFYNDEAILNEFFSNARKAMALDPGVYELSGSSMGPSFTKVKDTDSISPILNDDYQESILKDMQKFFANEKFYSDNGFAYKRGLLMFGPPGTGKTSSIKSIGHKLNLPLLFINKKVDLDAELKNTLDIACPNGCVCVLEDIDGVESYRRSELLNFLDGMCSPKRCYFIATTNYIDNIDFAFSQRPSRFDMLVEVPAPNEETREKIIQYYFKDRVQDFDLADVVKKTNGFTGAFIKELYILYVLNDIKIDTAIDRLKKHIDKSIKGETRETEDDNYMG